MTVRARIVEAGASPREAARAFVRAARPATERFSALYEQVHDAFDVLLVTIEGLPEPGEVARDLTSHGVLAARNGTSVTIVVEPRVHDLLDQEHPAVAAAIRAATTAVDAPPRNLIFDGRVLPLSQRAHVMGIVNVTPDSFSDGGRYLDTDEAIKHGVRLAEEGADLLDVGGESTRPGAEPVDAADEIRRVVPVIEGLRELVDVPISIDTMKAPVAEAALGAGATIVNDVSAGRYDPDILWLAAERRVPLVLMHMLGEPRTMQKDPRYEDVVGEVWRFLAERADAAIAAGVSPDRIVVDPGFGFGKTREHNLLLLKRLREFTCLGYPVLVGTSRKTFIGATLDVPVGDRVEGTAATVALAVANGAAIVRVHDVAPMRKVAGMVEAVTRAGETGATEA